jgi:hypothetical protein
MSLNTITYNHAREYAMEDEAMLIAYRLAKIESDQLHSDREEKTEMDDEESLDGNAFMTHHNNLSALARYYNKIAVNPDEADAEYEFWLTFEIRAFEEGSRDIMDVETSHYLAMMKERQDADDDEHDRMQQYIEDRADDDIDDRYD